MPASLPPHRRIALAIDAPRLADAERLVSELAPHVGVAKIGLELFTAEGPEAVRWAQRFGLDVFLDLKLHDIPETVERAVSAAAGLGVRYLTVHAQGGAAMMERAAERAEREKGPALLAVTVLTSLDAGDLRDIGVGDAPDAHVERLAKLAWKSGVRGFVSSAGEVARLRGALGPDALLVTPGIRPAGADAGDQKRVATPRDAVRSGADLVVIGRPLRDAPDRVAAARAIAAEIETGLRERA